MSATEWFKLAMEGVMPPPAPKLPDAHARLKALVKQEEAKMKEKEKNTK